jgi:hypothetical protein
MLPERLPICWRSSLSDPRIPAGLVTRSLLLALACTALAGGTAAAQIPTPLAPSGRVDAAGRGATLTARYHVRQMENVLERAVQHAADMMRRRLRAVTPDVLALAGTPRAQGYRIDGYGLFFSVEVPRLSESVNWALRALSQDSDERVLASLQKLAAAEQDPTMRADLERAIRSVQMQLAAVSRVSGVPPAAARRAGSAVAASADRQAPPVSGSAPEPPRPMTESDASDARQDADSTPPGETPMQDPSAAYEDEVKQALVDAMLDYAGPLAQASDEWVTVAARDAGYVAFPDAVTDMVTVTLSVRVADLIEFRAQRLTRDEARTRVIVKEF